MRGVWYMIELIRAYQLDIMLLLCGACGILVFLLINTRFLSKSRRRILILMEIFACLLLWFDRLAYIYAGGSGQTAFVMVRVSNFMVFFLTSAKAFRSSQTSCFCRRDVGCGNAFGSCCGVYKSLLLFWWNKSLSQGTGFFDSIYYSCFGAHYSVHRDQRIQKKVQ